MVKAQYVMLARAAEYQKRVDDKHRKKAKSAAREKSRLDSLRVVLFYRNIIRQGLRMDVVQTVSNPLESL